MNLISKTVLALCSLSILGTAHAGSGPVDREILCSIPNGESTLGGIRKIAIYGGTSMKIQRSHAKGARIEEMDVSSHFDGDGERFAWNDLQPLAGSDHRSVQQYVDALVADGMSEIEARDITTARYGSSDVSVEVVLRKNKAGVWALEQESTTMSNDLPCDSRGQDGTVITARKVIYCSDSADVKGGAGQGDGRSAYEKEFDRTYHR